MFLHLVRFDCGEKHLKNEFVLYGLASLDQFYPLHVLTFWIHLHYEVDEVRMKIAEAAKNLTNVSTDSEISKSSESPEVSN